MILNSSKDPVLVKKFHLKVWLLKDEIEYIIRSKVDTAEEAELINELMEKFTPEKPQLKLVKNEEDGEPAEESNEEEVEAKEDSDVEKNVDEAQLPKQRIPSLPDDKKYNACSFLSEINLEHGFFFSERNFLVGNSIILEFLVPEKFIVNAEVIFSQKYSMRNRIIGDKKTPYRVGVKFSFLKPGEKATLRKFLNSIRVETKEMNQKVDSNDDQDEAISEEMFELTDE